MKFAALAFALLLIGTLAHADVIPEGQHPVSRCTRVTNADAYPEIYIIGEIVAVGGVQDNSLHLVNSTACLSKGYKFNGLNIYWAKKSYIDSLGGVENVDLSVREQVLPNCIGECPPGSARNIIWNPNLHFITNEIDPYGGYVPDSNPKTNETIEYKVVKTADGYKLEGAAGDTPPAPPDTPAPKPENAPAPLEALWCWLMSIFGQSCQAYTR